MVTDMDVMTLFSICDSSPVINKAATVEFEQETRVVD
jgi:hypothetical protein